MKRGIEATADGLIGHAAPDVAIPTSSEAFAVVERIGDRCPGWRSPCRDAAVRPVAATAHARWGQRAADKRRKGRPWRCKRCAGLMMGERVRARYPAIPRHRCAGSGEALCPTRARRRAPKTRLERHRDRRSDRKRGREPWRCRHCVTVREMNGVDAKNRRARQERRARIHAVTDAAGFPRRGPVWWCDHRRLLRQLARQVGAKDPYPSPRPPHKPKGAKSGGLARERAQRAA